MITVSLLFFLVNFFSTIPYAARIVGVRTKMLAISFTLFNVIALLARTANGFQTPYLAKYIEVNMLRQEVWSPLPFLQAMILLSALGTISGALFIPTAQRLFTKGTQLYYRDRSLKRVFSKAFGRKGLAELRHSLKMPSPANFKSLFPLKDLPVKLFIYHGIATIFITIGPVAAIYAGFLHPEYRATASSMSFIINGIAVVIMFLLIDPPLSILTEDAVQGRISEPYFRRCIVWFVLARIAGVFAALLLLVPMAHLTSLFILLI